MNFTHHSQVISCLLAISCLPAVAAAEEKPLLLNEIPAEMIGCLGKERSERDACTAAVAARTPHWHITVSKDEITDAETVVMSVSTKMFYRGRQERSHLAVACESGRTFTILTLPGRWTGSANEVHYRIDGGEVLTGMWVASGSGKGLISVGESLPKRLWDIEKIVFRAYMADGLSVTATFDAHDFGKDSAWLTDACPQIGEGGR